MSKNTSRGLRSLLGTGILIELVSRPLAALTLVTKHAIIWYLRDRSLKYHHSFNNFLLLLHCTCDWVLKMEKTLPEKASSKIAQNQFIAINYNIHSCKTLAELIQFSFNYFLQVDSGSCLWNSEVWTMDCNPNDYVLLSVSSLLIKHYCAYTSSIDETTFYLLLYFRSLFLSSGDTSFVKTKIVQRR